jgi:uncharacterized membrane protein YagU involved in acid resistance
MVGFLAHLILSILMAMAYAVVFSLWPPAYWWRGLVLSVPHLVLTGIVIVSCALRRPEYRRYMWSPEQFKGTAHPGYDLLVLIVLHLIYGTTVGMLYTA